MHQKGDGFLRDIIKVVAASIRVRTGTDHPQIAVATATGDRHHVALEYAQ